jgi:hypothetical protein
VLVGAQGDAEHGDSLAFIGRGTTTKFACSFCHTVFDNGGGQ